MAPIAWSKSARVPYPPDAVFEWMTDFQVDDHARPAFVRASGADKTYPGVTARRTIVSRQGNNVVIHDEWGRNKFDLNVELVPLDRTVKLKGKFGYEAVWKAVPDGEATKVEAEVRIVSRGIIAFLFFFLFGLFRKRFYRELDQDFAGHMADLEESLKPAGP